MNNERIRMAALLVCWLCLLVAAPVAQAQSECGVPEISEGEDESNNENCVAERDDDDGGGGDVKKGKKVSYRPPNVTCPHLPPDRAVVYDYVENTQCQMVGEVVIGVYPDLVARGFIDAVDVWNYVNGGVEVCFRQAGWLVFLDATYIQRMPMELEHYHRDGMTCGMIDRIGTVALLESAAPAETPAAAESPATLPTFDSIPLSDCQIKLVETLFLRAAPAGEIIGLVWLNSEVPVFEINGYWYQVEFEGKTGYISRYHRRVLRGGCG